jgi:hypothetical protein
VKLRHCSDVGGEDFTVTGLQRGDEEIYSLFRRVLTSSNFMFLLPSNRPIPAKGFQSAFAINAVSVAAKAGDHMMS